MGESHVVVSVSRQFSQPAEQLFDAWLEAEGAKRFLFRSDGGEIIKCEIDPRVGGGFVITDRRPTGDAEHVGRYVEIDRPNRLVFEFGMPAESPDEDTVTLRFAPTTAGCEITLTAEMAPEYADYVDQVHDAWTEMLDKLAQSVAVSD